MVKEIENLKGKCECLQQENNKLSEAKNTHFLKSQNNHTKVNISELDIKSDSSTEEYLDYFRNLKNKIIETNKIESVLVDSSCSRKAKPENHNKNLEDDKSFRKNSKKIRNQDFVDKLEEKYKKTDEKFKKVCSNISNQNKLNSQNRLSVCLDNIENEKHEKVLIKQKLFEKLKQKKLNISKTKKKKMI